ncbi:hypothetical protein HZA33_03150 [Candidatus Pacearchaeota archaeon]|nr:hypothetical protein [Candidatus Pacearchaeota archaeon]
MRIEIQINIGEIKKENKANGKIPIFYAKEIDTAGQPTELLFGGYIDKRLQDYYKENGATLYCFF